MRRNTTLSLVSVCLALVGCASTPAERDASGSESAAASVEPLPWPDASAAAYVPLLEPAPKPRLEKLPTLEERDILAKLRRNFELPASDDAAVAAELDWYERHPEYIDRVLARGERYLHYIAGELEQRGMPADFALLPIIESAFDPFAYSHGRASGLWQIIPGTGRYLKLEQNWWFDGRRDVLESTRAALDYLERLHAQFDGDWLLAVAGYNSGAGNVSRALRRARDAGLGSDFFSIKAYLPRETRTYVPKLLAIRDVVADPDAYGVTLPFIEDTPYFAVVDTGGQIDMALAARLAGIEVDQLYALNAGVNRWATSPDGPHRMLVPVDRSAEFSKALAELGESERTEWTRHRIASGETLGHLAIRYQTTEAVLRQVNGLRGNTIRAGSYLMIPHALESLDTYSHSVDARTARQVGRERDGVERRHVVQSGDSLWTISRLYGVNVRELARWNAMAPGDVLSVGRELVVWTDTPVVAANTGTGTSQIRRVNYVVRRGDSLSSIAQRFRVSVSELLEWNDVSTNDYLQPGQRLLMYVDVTQQSS